jgi:hypothetical protein
MTNLDLIILLEKLSKIITIKNLTEKNYSISYLDFYNINNDNINNEIRLNNISNILSKNIDLNEDLDTIYIEILNKIKELSLKSFEEKTYNQNLIVDILDINDDINQRKFLTKINLIANIIASEGRFGPGQYILCNKKYNYYLSQYSGINYTVINEKIDDDIILMGRITELGQVGLYFIYYIEDNKLYYDICEVGSYTYKQYMMLKIK